MTDNLKIIGAVIFAGMMVAWVIISLADNPTAPQSCSVAGCAITDQYEIERDINTAKFIGWQDGFSDGIRIIRVPDTVYVVDSTALMHAEEQMREFGLLWNQGILDLAKCQESKINIDSAMWAPFEKSNPQPVTCACTISAIGPCDKCKGPVVKR